MAEGEGYLPLFETKPGKGRIVFYCYVVSIFVGILCICFYRLTYIPLNHQIPKYAWIGLFMAELYFTLYWFLTLVNRWNPIYRRTFKDRLSLRFEKDLPGIDIFVCTADPKIEPPIMVINTVLSVMSYNYPPEKTSVYLSDDGGSDLTFYALLEASIFAQKWLPFCKKFKVEPRSPDAYFKTVHESTFDQNDPIKLNEWLSIKKLYEEMRDRIKIIIDKKQITKEIRKQHKGFGEWDLVSNQRDHHTILQILIDGRDSRAVDIEGQPLPNLVYLAREKRPHVHHNFKAGAMNALIRVSSRISNAPIILNVDCDMYSNNSESVRDALCFLMDEEKGQRFAYVQYPQKFENITKNDLYSSTLRVIMQYEMPGIDGIGGPLYIGTGCFHKRETLCGKIYSKDYKEDWKRGVDRKVDETVDMLEGQCKELANCSYEENSQWGKEIGLKYGFLVEDVITGLSIQCRGWRSVYFSPERVGFLGLAPTTLLQSLIQHKRWSEGEFQIGTSKYNPLVYGHRRIPLKLQLAYCPFNLWAPCSLPSLYYVLVPTMCLLKGISLFPQISSLWVLPFVYVIFAHRLYSFYEYVSAGSTVQEWWNDQRMWMYKRTTSYLFGFVDHLFKLLGFKQITFVITEKVVEEEVSKRYEQEVMEFGSSSPMFTILATIALLNAFSFVGGVGMVIMGLRPAGLQILLSGILSFMNLPIFEGMFFRKDKGSLPKEVTYKSIMLAILACSISLY